MGKILYFLCFILSVFPTDANENRRHIHVTRRGSKNAHIGDTVAKIWIEKNGERCIEIAWSELSSDEEADIISVIENHYDYINDCYDRVINGKKVDILRINKKQ